MRTPFELVIIASCMVLSALADRTHDVFSANRDAILARPLTVCGEVAFSVGRATSPRNRGDAVGYTKAEEQAKWNLGERYRTSAPWPGDILPDEKELVWAEYRRQHPERFSVFGMQRILSKKTPPDGYLVVLSFPAEHVNVPPPTADELARVFVTIRERKRAAEERTSRRVAEQDAPSAGDSERSAPSDSKNLQTMPTRPASVIEKHDTLDESLML